MGQMFPNDPYSNLIKKPTQLNSKPVKKYHQLKTIPQIRTCYYQITHFNEDDQKIQCLYRFFINLHVLVELTKKKQRYIYINKNQGLVLNGEMVYGYKVKYRYKANDKIKNILYKKRIYGDVKTILDTIAQLKLISILQIGPYFGSMINGVDGQLFDGYAEYFTQSLPNARGTDDRLLMKLKKIFDNFDDSCLKNLGFSQFFHELVLKTGPILFEKQSGIVSQIPLTNIEDGLQSNRNLSILLGPIPSSYVKGSASPTAQQKYIKSIKAIDEKTFYLSAIQNSLVHKNIQKAISLYQENLNKLETNTSEKIRYIYNFIQLLSDCGYFKEYQEQVINQTLTDNELKWDEEIAKQYRKDLQQKVTSLKLQSKEFSSENQLQQFSQTYSVDQSNMQKSKLKINIQQSNKLRVKQIIKQINISYRFRNYGSGRGKQSQGIDRIVNYEYAVMLMKSGKSRLALILFEFLLRDEQCDQVLKYKIRCFMGLIYHYRSFHPLARKQWELAAERVVKMRYFTPILTLIYNNIACSFYAEAKYDRAIQILTYALQNDYGHNDYISLLHNNRGLTFLALNQQKEAKQQFMRILSRGEPLNNAYILCRIYANLGYMNMKSKQFAKAKQDFKIAMEIQQRCLIPNGHRPSPYMHNNIAMVRFKLQQYRQALDHFIKYSVQFDQLKGIQAVMISYNMARAYKQCYKNQVAKQYIEKAKRLLAGLKIKQRERFEKKLEFESQNINKNNIDQVDEESSGAVLEHLMSIASRKHQQNKDDFHSKHYFQ